MEEIGKYMIQTNTKPTNLVVNDGKLQSFQIQGTTYTLNQFIPMTQELCKNMIVEYTGQSMRTILKTIINFSNNK